MTTLNKSININSPFIPSSDYHYCNYNCYYYYYYYQAIDQYIKLREEAEANKDEAATDPRLESIVEKMFTR